MCTNAISCFVAASICSVTDHNDTSVAEVEPTPSENVAYMLQDLHNVRRELVVALTADLVACDNHFITVTMLWKIFSKVDEESLQNKIVVKGEGMFLSNCLVGCNQQIFKRVS